MLCGACESDLSRDSLARTHCGSQTCDWIRCEVCGAVNQANGTRYFMSPIKNKKKKKGKE